MAVPLYFDVHVPEAIAVQLRRRGVDVLTAIEDESDRLPDDELLERATRMGRVLFTQDIRFKAMAQEWQAEGRAFAGLLYGHQMRSIGEYVEDLHIIAEAGELQEYLNVVQHLPL